MPIFLREWDSIVCISLPINTTMNLRVPSLFEQRLFSQQVPVYVAIIVYRQLVTSLRSRFWGA